MEKPLNIVDVEIIQDCGIVVNFSDGSSASFPSEELAALRPYREKDLYKVAGGRVMNVSTRHRASHDCSNT